jgi:hypothetical protein
LQVDIAINKVYEHHAAETEETEPS